MKRQDNPLFRLLMWNGLAGAVAALVLIGGLIATDAMHIRQLIFASADPIVPLAMLTVGFLVTLCSVAMGSAIMALPADEAPRDRGLGQPVAAPEPAPVRVAVRRARNP